MHSKTTKKQHGIPCCQCGVPNPQKCHSNGPKVHHNTPPRPSIRPHFVILCLPFCEVRKMIDLVVKKHANPKKTHSVLEAFLNSKSEVNSSLNSTCSCLYVYCSRTLPKRHVDPQMCSKGPKSGVKIKPTFDLELIF